MEQELYPGTVSYFVFVYLCAKREEINGKYPVHISIWKDYTSKGSMASWYHTEHTENTAFSIHDNCATERLSKPMSIEKFLKETLAKNSCATVQ